MTMKMARVKANLTQAQVAHRMGVSLQSYNKYEKNPHTMTIALALKFCKAVGAELDAVDFVQENDLFF